MGPCIHTIGKGGQDLSATSDTFNLVSKARKESLVYLGFSYDLARGRQDELLRWAEEQRRIKRVRSHHQEERLLPRSKMEDVHPSGEEVLERRAS